jgi:urease subunit gamma/beta
MHLTPRERERLLLAAAADLARRRLARGAPLGATEAVALVCDEICELAWDGVALETVIERARAVVPAAALLPGVAGLVPVLEVEALFPWGSTLVHVDAPFTDDRDQNPDRERSVASPGTVPGSASPPIDATAPDPRAVDPVPTTPGAGPGRVTASSAGPAAYAGAAAPGAGEIRAAPGHMALAPGAPRRTVLLRNTGQRDVWISSHFPLDQVNPAVEIRFTGDAKTPSVPHPDVKGGTGDDSRTEHAGTGHGRTADAGTRDGGTGDGGTGHAGTADAGTEDGRGTPGRVSGCRLDLPAGEALLLRPGEARTATIVVTSGGQA